MSNNITPFKPIKWIRFTFYLTLTALIVLTIMDVVESRQWKREMNKLEMKSLHLQIMIHDRTLSK